MNDFKLLAIRPLIGCDKKYLKNLTAGQAYQFYPTYGLIGKSVKKLSRKEEILFIKPGDHLPAQLYSTPSADGHKFNINVSAIAGKNGSGKSTLVELLFATIYVFAVSHEILEPNLISLEEDHKNNLKELPNIESRLKLLTNKKRNFFKDYNKKLTATGASISFKELNKILEDFEDDKKELTAAKIKIKQEINNYPKKIADINLMRSKLKVELYYERYGIFYRLRIDSLVNNSGTSLCIVPSSNSPELVVTPVIKTDKLDFTDFANHFFYSIAVNYSHYSLNAGYMGEWLNSLFHKNDGYQTPLVINPMRTDGDFKINSEISFAKYRLLSNILIANLYRETPESKVAITPNQHIHQIKFILNKAKIKKIPMLIRSTGRSLTGDKYALRVFKTLIGDYLFGLEEPLLMSTSFPLKDVLINYIVQKVEKIKQYPGFNMGYELNENTPFVQNSKFFKALKDDQSHITYKLKQAINFLKYCLSAKEDQPFWLNKGQLENKSQVSFSLSLSELMDWMKNPPPLDMLSLLPPSIFDIDFELSNNFNSVSLFSDLSSGEQQQVHTIQSVIYHLNNLQSAHLSGVERMKYDTINIIYDEIELYFHPAYQRNFISDLLKAIGGLHVGNQGRIKSINILFLTHSPFILSDIPKENIMLLSIDEKTGKSMPEQAKDQTFAANINELLAENFFLSGTLIGSFAEKELRKIINKIKANEEVTADDKKLLAMVGDSFLRSSLQKYLSDKK